MKPERITSFKQVEAFLTSDHGEDEQIEAVFMTQIECAMCGPIWTSTAEFTQTGERAEGKIGSLLIPEDEQLFLMDDARAFLRAHIEKVHPGWHFVIDGDHDNIRARRCGRKPRR